MIEDGKGVYKLGRKENELYIGVEHLDLESNRPKHPASITYYNNINANKIKKKPIKLIGLDLETNHKTSELKLLGFYDGNRYDFYLDNFIGALFNQVKKASQNNYSIAYWNKLDPFVIYKQFLLLVSEDEQRESLERFGRISGEWDRETANWKPNNPPIISIKILGHTFGISNIIRSSIQFFYKSDYKDFLNKVWAFDIATLYPNGLATEGKRFPYYSKVDESAHLVDWNKFYKEQYYRENIVLKSNKLDAMVVRDLGILVQENFYKLFDGFYPNTLISAGSLCRAGIIGAIYKHYETKYDDEKLLKKKVYREAKSIAIASYYDEWIKKYGSDIVKELFCITNEAYSGGYIETLQYGFTKEAYMSDIASAYPSEEVKLFDLRGSKITYGYGEPPNIPNSYCFIRGEISVPKNLNFNPITIKHPFSNITNIRGVGNYKASYILSTRKLLKKYHVTFNNEFWINIETKGKLSPFAFAINTFLESREYLKSIGDDAEQLAKAEANSGYGITYECTPIYDVIDGKIMKTGFRGGEFYNPIYASIITGRIRNKLTEASLEIEQNGGKVVLMMTDSIFWTGNIDNMTTKWWKEPKTLGYFEKPIKVNNFMCLGAGRYEYYLDNEKYKGKTRGISISDLLNDEGVIINKFNWKSLVYKAQKLGTSILDINTRILVSPPLVLRQDKYNVKDLGLVKVEKREVDIVAGKSKRIMILENDWLDTITEKMIDTRPLYIMKGFDGTWNVPDFTLPHYRKHVKNQLVIPKSERIKDVRKEQNKRYREKHQKDRNKRAREHYSILRKYGFTPAEAKAYSNKNKKELYDIINRRSF